MAIEANFGQPCLQRLHLLSELGQLLLLQAEFPFQQADLLLLSSDQFSLQADRFLLQAGLLSQHPILVSQVNQFFVCSHALTLHTIRGFGKSLGDLSSYGDFF